MLEKKLSAELKAIFGFDKVTLRAPDDTAEQEVLFVEITEPNYKIRDGIEHARVEARCTVFVEQGRMPFGHFDKMIAQADHSLTKNFFFFDVDQNVRTYADLVERTFRLIYFFNGQYDPDNGTLNEVTIEVQT